MAFSTFLQHVNCGLAQDVLLSGGRVQYVVDVAQAKALAAAAGGASLTSAAALPSGKDAAAAVAAAFAGSEGTQTLFSYRVADAGGAIERMIAQGVDFRAARPQTWAALIPRVLSVAYLVFLVYFFRRMFTDTGGAKMTGQQAQRVKETFDDVAGLTEAKASVVEVVNILRNPGRSRGGRWAEGCAECSAHESTLVRRVYFCSFLRICCVLAEGGGGLLETTPARAPAAATRRNMRREERVTVQGSVKKQQPDGMSHRGAPWTPSPAPPSAQATPRGGAEELCKQM